MKRLNLEYCSYLNIYIYLACDHNVAAAEIVLSSVS